MTDIEIAQSTKLSPIQDIAVKIGVNSESIDVYGKYMAKLPVELSYGEARGKLVLVTAISPTPAGEGKTTITISLADALRRLGKNAAVAIREPSLGPVFGIKGGATGGGYAQVLPMTNINLHFTGDFHALTTANNLLAAMVDNHIFHGNALRIDPRNIAWKRCIDMNDRQLRNVIDGLGGVSNGSPREDGFDISVASEIMAVLCLSKSMSDLKERIARIIVGYTYDNEPVTAGDLKAQGALCALLADAIKPNLVQTIEGTPAIIHGGPFANIAHGCNSIIATKTALNLADYAVTEAGFGADLGAEKFIDIKCRELGQLPAAVVIVATVRALAHHGGFDKKKNTRTHIECVKRGMPNLIRHIRNMEDVFKVNCVVAINSFTTDTEEEYALIQYACEAEGVKAIVVRAWSEGGKGALELANEVVRLSDTPSTPEFAYDIDMPVKDKLDNLVKRVYGGDGVELTSDAVKQEKQLVKLGYGKLPVCVAKTQYSFSDDQKLINAPTGFKVTVRQLKLCAGAGFIVALTGNIMTMPGLPEHPAAERIDVTDDGEITGLF